MSALAESVPAYDETEPNDTLATADELILGQTYVALCASSDLDYLRFTLDEPSVVEIKTTQFGYRLSSDWIDEYPHEFFHSPAGRLFGNIPNGKVKNAKHTLRVSLSAGDHEIVVMPYSGHRASTTGYYSVNVRVVKPAKPKILIPRNMTAAVGTNGYIDWDIRPTTLFWPDISITSSKPDVASFKSGEYHGFETHKTGKTTITLTMGGVSARMTLNVVNNEYKRQKPVAGKKRQVYVSHKSISYKDGYVDAKVYVTNRTKQRLVGMRNLKAIVHDYSGGGRDYYGEQRDWFPDGGIAPGKTGVYAFRYSAAGTYIPNFRKGKCLATLEGEAVLSGGKAVALIAP